MSLKNIYLLAITVFSLSLFACDEGGSKTSRGSSGATAGGQQGGNGLPPNGSADGQGQFQSQNNGLGNGQQPGNGNQNQGIGNGSQNNSGGLGDLLGQAGDLLNNLGNNNSDNSNSNNNNDNSNSSSSTNLKKFKFSDFDEGVRSQNFFTINANGPVQGDSPHGIVRIYYSKDIEDLVGEQDFEVPVGTVAVKQFDNDSTHEGFDGLAIMVKQEAGYDAEGGDWYYELKNNFGGTIDGKKGIVGGCKGCHNDTTGKKFDRLKGLEKAGM